MTPQDHNKTLGIIYGFLGGLLTLAAIVELVRVTMLERELERLPPWGNVIIPPRRGVIYT